MTAIRKRGSEAGYALLFVYSLAASAAILLYMELPRVIFEAQRDKEQLLIDRGEQYSRAVQLYVRKYNRFPVDMDALEKTQGIRFLRRKYVDPMTGKDDWRIVHVGPGGQFVDSLVYGKKNGGDKNAPQTFITEMQQMGGNAAAGGQNANIGTRTRASDQSGPGGPAGGAANDPSATQPVSGPVMVLPDGRIVPANSTGQAPPAAQPGQNQGIGGQFNPGGGGSGNLPGQPVTQNGQNGFGAPGGVQGGFNGFQTPNGIAVQPNAPGAPPSAAAGLINQILTTPRPQPNLPGGIDPNGNALNGGAQQRSGDFSQSSGTTGGLSSSGQIVGGGFAGVASKLEQEGIKSYGSRTAYNEWEFVYDITKDPTRALNGNRAQTGQSGQQGQTSPTGQQQQPGGGASIPVTK